MAAVMVLREVQAGPVIEYLNKQSDLTTAAKVLKELMGKREVPASAKFTLLAPTNEVRLCNNSSGKHTHLAVGVLHHGSGVEGVAAAAAAPGVSLTVVCH